MSKITYPANSPYSNTPQTDWYLGRFVYKDISPDSGDSYYTLLARHTYRPDLLSYELYNTPQYWWVFCIRNPFLRADPIWNFIAGLTIVVPSLSYISSTIGN